MTGATVASSYCATHSSPDLRSVVTRVGSSRGTAARWNDGDGPPGRELVGVSRLGNHRDRLRGGLNDRGGCCSRFQSGRYDGRLEYGCVPPGATRRRSSARFGRNSLQLQRGGDPYRSRWRSLKSEVSRWNGRCRLLRPLRSATGCRYYSREWKQKFNTHGSSGAERRFFHSRTSSRSSLTLAEPERNAGSIRDRRDPDRRDQYLRALVRLRTATLVTARLSSDSPHVA
jgi:hypothetical protein